MNQDKLTDEEFYNCLNLSKKEFDDKIKDCGSMGALLMSNILNTCITPKLRTEKYSILVELFPKIMVKISEKYCEQIMYFAREGSNYASNAMREEKKEEIKRGL